MVEWQTRRTQNPLRDDLVRVQVPPSAPKKRQISTGVCRFFIQDRRAWYVINTLCVLYVIAPKERMASREACMFLSFGLDYILPYGRLHTTLCVDYIHAFGVIEIREERNNGKKFIARIFRRTCGEM